MALKWAGSRVSMSVSQATTSVRLSCACERRGRTPAAPIAATPTVPFRNDRRSMRGLMLALLSGSLLDRLRRDVAHFHRRPPRLRRWLSSGDRFEAVQQVARLQHPVLLTGRAVDGDQPRVAGGPQRDEERLDRGARLQLDREAIAALRHEAAQVAVHVDRHRHSRSSARTRGMTSVWKRWIVVSMRPSTASG